MAAKWIAISIEWWLHLAAAVTATLAIVGLTHYIRRYARRNAVLNMPNAPPGPPVPTNYLNPFAYDAHLLWQRWKKGYQSMGHVLVGELLTEAEIYPNGVFRVFFMFTPMVILTRAETVRVLLESNRLLTKSDFYIFLEPWLGTGLLTSTGNKWRSSRKLLTSSFHFEILNDFVGVFSEQAEVMNTLIHKTVGQEIDIMKLIKNATLDIICETAMGLKVDAQTTESEYLRAQLIVSEKFLERVLSPWQWPALVYPMLPSGRTFFSNLHVVQKFTREVIAKRMQEHTEEEKPLATTGQPRRRRAFLDLLISEYRRTGSAIDPEEIREQVDTFMFAGHDTTAMGIGWSLYLIGHHPEVQARVHEELDAVIGPDSTWPITLEDIKQMKYLEAVIKEAQRLYPSVPFMGRCLDDDITVGEYHIPRGTNIFVFVTALHRDPRYFPDPLRFDPLRFYGLPDGESADKLGPALFQADEKTPPTANARHPFAFVPFSAGPRNCIGQRFAMYEEKVVLASVLRRFSVESVRPLDEIPVRALHDDQLQRCNFCVFLS